VTDVQIIELYWARDEQAIKETDLVYGRRLHHLADRIVSNFEDAQECVSDTYLKTWDTIPPKRPEYFFAYIAKICRNFALGVLDWIAAHFRPGEILVSLMSQYTPVGKQMPPLDRPITETEYDAVLSYLELLGIEDGYTQDFQAAAEEYIPDWDLSGL